MRLREQEVYSGNFDKDPHAVHDVVLPTDGVQSNGVDICVEEDGEPNGKLLNGDALGSLLEREDLDHVGISQGVPADVIEPKTDKSAP